MRILTGLRNTGDVPAVDPAHAEHDRQVRQARLELARRQSTWAEIPETRLVRRGPFLVDAQTDLVYRRRRGVVFEPGNATVGFVAPNTPLTFFADRDDEIGFLEPVPGATTWSSIVERRARRR